MCSVLAFYFGDGIIQPMKALSLLCILMALASSYGADLNHLTPEEKAAGWSLLFNGKNLEGWRQYGRQAPPAEGWKVEDGVLKKVAKQRGGDIIHTNTFGDFDFSWEWRVGPGGNNGVKYLVTEQRPGAPGHEYQMIDDAGHPDGKIGAHRQTAAFYDVLPPDEKKPIKKAGEWNSSRILVKGSNVEHWLNGAKVLNYELGSDAVKAAVGKSKFKSAARFGEKIQGHIMLTDHSDEAWFRNLKIRPLK